MQTQAYRDLTWKGVADLDLSNEEITEVILDEIRQQAENEKWDKHAHQLNEIEDEVWGKNERLRGGLPQASGA